MVNDVWAEILGVYASPTAPREPFKFTEEQWRYLRTKLPVASPEPWTSAAGALANLTGVPVVIVDTEEESTPVLENWGWGARLADDQWPGAVAEFQRLCEEASHGDG